MRGVGCKGVEKSGTSSATGRFHEERRTSLTRAGRTDTHPQTLETGDCEDEVGDPQETDGDGGGGGGRGRRSKVFSGPHVGQGRKVRPGRGRRRQGFVFRSRGLGGGGGNSGPHPHLSTPLFVPSPWHRRLKGGLKQTEGRDPRARLGD